MHRDKRKKILFVIMSLAGGGAERVIVNIVNNLDKAKYDIHLVHLEEVIDYRIKTDQSVNIFCLGKKID